MDTNTRYDDVVHYTHTTASYGSDRTTRATGTRTTGTNTSVPATDFGGGWYHDAAIQDAKHAHAHPYR